MTDLLSEGYRLVSVVAPKFDPREFVPDLETKIECSRLVKARR